MKGTVKSVNHFAFIAFAITFVILTNKYFYYNKSLPIVIGMFITITGLWGFVIKDIVLKIPHLEAWSRTINILLVTLGMVCILYGILNSFVV